MSSVLERCQLCDIDFGIGILDLVYKQSEEVYGNEYIEEHSEGDNEGHLPGNGEGKEKYPVFKHHVAHDMGYDLFPGNDDEDAGHHRGYGNSKVKRAYIVHLINGPEGKIKSHNKNNAGYNDGEPACHVGVNLPVHAVLPYDMRYKKRDGYGLDYKRFKTEKDETLYMDGAVIKDDKEKEKEPLHVQRLDIALNTGRR